MMHILPMFTNIMMHFVQKYPTVVEEDLINEDRRCSLQNEHHYYESTKRRVSRSPANGNPFCCNIFLCKETTQDYIIFWQIPKKKSIVSFDYSFHFFLKAEVV